MNDETFTAMIYRISKLIYENQHNYDLDLDPLTIVEEVYKIIEPMRTA
jgi:hypothetical protein